MTDGSLGQAEADRLLQMEKRRASDDDVDYPGPGERISAPLVSVDGRERFHLDLHRGGINLRKYKYQNRWERVIVLARLDFGGAPHRNPNDEEVDSPHLHLYREGFGDRWAFPVPSDDFSNLDDPWTTLEEFMRFCNVAEPPLFRRGLFT